MAGSNSGDGSSMDLSRLIQDALAELGADVDVADVVEKVRRLNIGLPVEDEFSVVCTWLGQCDLLHKLDQNQVPIKSKENFQVPDLLAKFSTQSKNKPLLIEVKAKNEKTLSFQPDYFKRLNNYAEMMGLPLLIAWKFNGVWTLFEARHMQKAVKNYNIKLEYALKQNLLCRLAGDVAFVVGNQAGIHLDFRKDKVILGSDGFSGEIKWQVTFDNFYFTDYEGVIRTDFSPEVQALFTGLGLEEKVEETNSHIKIHYVADGKQAQFCHATLVKLLDWENSSDSGHHWRGLLRSGNVVESIVNLRETLELALNKKVVYYVLDIQPEDIPSFL